MSNSPSPIHIKLRYNKAYQWSFFENVSFIGYCWFNNTPIDAAYYFKKLFVDPLILSPLNLINAFERLNGAFSVVITLDDAIIAYSDKTRYFPIFYLQNSNLGINLSDDIYYLSETCSKKNIDKQAKLHYLAVAFTPNGKTLFEDINQIKPGEVIYYHSNKIETFQIFRYAIQSNQFLDYSFDQLKLKTQNAIDNAFDRHLKLITGKNVLLPLSGGFDSRLIAMKLKEFGFQNVISLTYGRKNKEVEISKKVARNLGFEWHFVEYNEKLLKDFHTHREFEDYAFYAARGNSMFYLQEYPAIKYLFDHHIIDSSFVVIPGHSGDVNGGSMMVKNYPPDLHHKYLRNTLFSKRFIHSKLNTEEQYAVKILIDQYLIDKVNDELIPFSILEEWEYLERLPKYIFNSTHAFGFFDIKAIFPFWDSELVEFFRKVPYEYRKFQRLNHEVLRDKYFSKFNIDFVRDIQPSSFDLRKTNIKQVIRPHLPRLVKHKLLKKNDWVEYGYMTEKIKSDMPKELLRENGSSYLNPILSWYLWKIQGK